MDNSNHNGSDYFSCDSNVSEGSDENNDILNYHDSTNVDELSATDVVQTATETIVRTNKEGGSGESVECSIHAESFLKYYCSLCNIAVCEKCTEEEHAGHTTVALSDAAAEHKTSLITLVSRIKQLIPEIETAIAEVENTRKQLEVNTAAAEVKIMSLFDELASLVQERKQSALAELEQVSVSKQLVLTEQKQSLHRHLACINSCCQLTVDKLQGARDTDVVMVKREMEGKLNDLITGSPVLHSETNPLAIFSEQGFDSLRKMISNLGSVINNTAVSYQASVEGDAFSGCVVGKASTVTVTTRDKNGAVVKTGLAPVTAYISSDKHEERLVPTISDHQDGTYDITFVLQDVGVHYLSIFLFGQQTRGSPYKIRAEHAAQSKPNGSESLRTSRMLTVNERSTKRSSSSRSHGSCNRHTSRIDDDLIMRVGVKGRNKGEFSNPQGVCCHDDKVVVADSNNQCVQVFVSSGDCCLKFGAPGRGPGKIQRPTGVAVTHSGNYLVADYDNKWVSVFGPDGKYLNHVGCGRLQGPKGVAVDREDNIIVVDNKCNSVLVFQENGKLINKFGCRGNWEEQLAGPHYAAVNGEGDIIVSDFHNHCVKVYDSSGKFKFRFGSNGEGNGQFNAPTGVAVDEKGNMLVADWGNSRIQVFDSSGSFLSFVNTVGEPLYGPQGLAVSSLGVVVVADSGNHCIKYYKYLQ